MTLYENGYRLWSVDEARTVQWMRNHYGNKGLGLYRQYGGEHGITTYVPYYKDRIAPYTVPRGLVQIEVDFLDGSRVWINCRRCDLISCWDDVPTNN